MNDLEKIKATTKTLFDAVPLEGHPDFGPIVVCHPFTETAFVMLPPARLINILEDKDGYEDWRKWWFKQIDNAPSVETLMCYVCKAWRLTFIKYTKRYMDRDTFSELFADAWVSSENPNMDTNCSRKEMVQWFKSANKNKLMEEADYQYWLSLPEQFDVYRGVAAGREELGLSWTRNRETAEWFASRWKGDSYVLKATIDKKHALAYLNTRNEDEVVVDVFAIKNRIEKI